MKSPTSSIAKRWRRIAQLVSKYFAYTMEENRSASEHVLRMSGYYDHLNQVGVNLPDKIVIDRIL